MSHLLAILIVGVTIAAERGLRYDVVEDLGMRGWPAATVAWGGPLLILLWQWGITVLCARRLSSRGKVVYLEVADRTLLISQWLIVGVHVASVYALGWSPTVGLWLGGDWVLVDTLIVITPPVLALAGSWWIHQPVVDRVRHASLIRQLDEGKPIHTPPSRLRCVVLQVRVHLLFLLVPLLLIVSVGDGVDLLLPPDGGRWMSRANEIVSFVGALTVFLLAPAVARHVLDLSPMPVGQVRDDLLQVCHDQRVKVRDVMLWNSDGTMINGAVMGLIAPVRYVMITDGLLETLRRDQVLAVMAHEVGHVRRWHMPWLIATILAVMMAPALILDIALLRFDGPVWVADSSLAVIGLFVFLGFGWVSRRFERQADTFAAQHLSGMRPGGSIPIEGVRTGQILPEAAEAMRSALERVCRLNGMNPKRRSWRHGSIHWRQTYLSKLVGLPLTGLPIDRQVRAIKLATVITLLVSVAGAVWLESESAKLRDQRPFAPGQTSAIGLP